MPDLSIELHLQRGQPALQTGKYSSAQKVHFTSAHKIDVDAALDWGGDPANFNQEPALASALSGCHMMTFLALAAKAGWPVAGYQDRAVAHLDKNAKGQMSVTRIDTGLSPDKAELEKMQHHAHHHGFIANALADSVAVNIL